MSRSINIWIWPHQWRSEGENRQQRRQKCDRLFTCREKIVSIFEPSQRAGDTKRAGRALAPGMCAVGHVSPTRAVRGANRLAIVAPPATRPPLQQWGTQAAEENQGPFRGSDQTSDSPRMAARPANSPFGGAKRWLLDRTRRGGRSLRYPAVHTDRTRCRISYIFGDAADRKQPFIEGAANGSARAGIKGDIAGPRPWAMPPHTTISLVLATKCQAGSGSRKTWS